MSTISMKFATRLFVAALSMTALLVSCQGGGGGFSTSEESLGQSVAGMFNDTIAVGPDNRQIAYVIRRHDKWIVVVNGTEQQPYDGIGEAHPIVSR